ncbi:MAG: AMP-binding protein [Enterocloster bolteae]
MSINSHEKCYPIGTLNPNLKGYIVDEDGKPVKPGTEGELWLAGPQITRGYFKRPERTREQFIDNPFDHEEGFGRIFKTRDIVRQLEDGNLQYITRKDNIV